MNWACSVPGIHQKTSHLRKRLNRLETQNEAAQDDLFEIEIAYRLFKQGLEVEFAEPDVVIHISDNLGFAIACKRPRTIGAIQKNIQQGANQIRTQRIPGIVTIGMEAIMHNSDDPERPNPAWYTVDQQDQLEQAAEPFFADAIRRSNHEISRSFNKGVVGVYFCGLITGICRNPSAHLWHWHRDWVESPTKSGLMPLLDGLLFGDETAGL